MKNKITLFLEFLVVGYGPMKIECDEKFIDIIYEPSLTYCFTAKKIKNSKSFSARIVVKEKT